MRDEMSLNAAELTRYRAELPITQNLCYLDHASLAPLPCRVTEAITRLLAQRSEQGSLLLTRFGEMVEASRARAAAFIGAQPEEVAFVKNTTEGVLLAAESIDWRTGDNVVTVRGEFPANVYPWLMLGRRGVEIRYVEPDQQGRVTIEDLMARVDRRTRVLTISHVQFATGYAMDLGTLGRACADAGVLLFVDAAQSLGVLRVDARAAGISMLSANSGKWLLGPGGAAIFYCAAEVLDRLTLTNIGWRSVRHPGDASNIRLDLRAGAARLEEGSWNVSGIVGLATALDLLTEVGMDRVEARVLALTKRLATSLQQRGCEIISSREPGESSGIVSFRLPGHSPGDMVTKLRAQGVVVSLSGGAVRVSPHFYNLEAEIDSLIDLLPG